ncbi:phage portal family protein [Leeuwenhoekiella nanhaiensis]|uniref:Phage portal protein n=1 Tax=Leeuwenhoekiella nanhaiensis TaxID=1655491 RepID=A0A2G1VLR3_9FLAO|nr:hypothetical protein [Leeuwenhoekiella nanhaiensis]PHQ27701.1 hypothetical protein CJ305_18720 [Leeuwenhoekiella nanhaiensis]
MSLKSAFIEIIKRVAKFDKAYGIHNNGVDNNYPELVESRIANSVTALACKDTKASFLSGKGFGDDLNKLIVNKKKGTTLLQFTQDIADSIAEHNGVYIHANYNSLYEISTLQVLPFPDCRLSKEDDDKNVGKVLVCSDWKDSKLAKKARKVDFFNPKKKVVTSQVNTAGGIKKYNGQIFYWKAGKYIYPLSPIHPCLDDADSEKQAGVFKNTSLRKGFFGKTLFVTKPMVDPHLDKETQAKEIQEQKSEREAFRKTVKQFVGAENVDGVMHIELELESDKLEDEIFIKNIDANINDKLFAHTENSVSNNICISYRIPPMLIRPTDKSLFSSSGEAIREMKTFYQEQTSDERMMVEEIVRKLMALHADKPEAELKLIPLIAQTNANVDQ